METRQVEKFIVLLFLMTSNLLYAQKDSLVHHQIVLSLGGGVAIPTGNFSTYAEKNTPYSSPTNIAGSAEIRIIGKVQGSYFISKKFGVTCILYSASNPTEHLSKDSLFPQYPYPGLGAPQSYATSYLYNAKNWYSSGILLGCTMSFNADFVTFNLRLSGGYQQTRSPEIQIDETGYTTGGILHYPSYTYVRKITQSEKSDMVCVWVQGLILQFL